MDSPTSPSPEMFSFPGTPTDDVERESSEFEFESCITPNLLSPSIADDPTERSASPADQFFLNGRLLPHDFPIASSRNSFSGKDNVATSYYSNSSANLSRGTSVGSSMSNKDSFMSSRSNSTKSTCSTSSSARTSSSEISEKRTFQRRMMRSLREKRNATSPGLTAHYGNYYQAFGGSSKRWQFITPAPVLGPSRSRRGRRDSGSVGSTASPKNKKREEGHKKETSGCTSEGLIYRVLRSFIATCKSCHAMEGQENDFDLDGEVLAN